MDGSTFVTASYRRYKIDLAPKVRLKTLCVELCGLYGEHAEDRTIKPAG